MLPGAGLRCNSRTFASAPYSAGTAYRMVGLRQRREGRSVHQGSSERPRRYCTNCGTQASPGDAFCANCGARLPSGSEDEVATREISRPTQGREGGRALPALRFPGVGRDIMLGGLLALACAALLVAALYAVLAARGAFSDTAVPGALGLALFALMHGGGASLDVPPIPALFEIGRAHV